MSTERRSMSASRCPESLQRQLDVPARDGTPRQKLDAAVEAPRLLGSADNESPAQAEVGHALAQAGEVPRSHGRAEPDLDGYDPTSVDEP